jgi:hypothetical protein
MTVGGDGPLGRPLTTHEFVLSGRHDGLALFLGRVLKPLWKEHIGAKTYVSTIQDDVAYLIVTHSDI